jgi:GT2 family glycosyltransferase
VREGVRRDLAALGPRCETLENTLPEHMRHHRGYLASKLQVDFTLVLGDDVATPRRSIATLTDPAPLIHRPAVAEAGMTLDQSLHHCGAMLVVGGVADPRLHAFLAARQATGVMSGDGTPALTDGRRPAANAFSAWLAGHDEQERSELGAIVLGRAAGMVDVNLLRHRLYPHQHVLVEAGSAALAWLLAEWEGNVVRHGGVFDFTKPSGVFREPSGAARMSVAEDWPRISVVTVSYNQRQYLEQCLRSVLDQGYPNLEYIVVDAGSTDGSIEMLRRYEAQLAQLVVEPDDGQSDGLNKGFNLTKGDILTWVNSDDMLAPLALKRAALAFAESGADLVAGTCSRVLDDDAHLLYRHHAALPTQRRVAFDISGPLSWCDAWEKGDFFFQPEVFFTRDIWERAGGYLKPHLYWAMDWDLWLRCALAGASVIRIPDVLGVSRVHKSQKTTSDEVYLWQIMSILREYGDLFAMLEHAAATA